MPRQANPIREMAEKLKQIQDRVDALIRDPDSPVNRTGRVSELVGEYVDGIRHRMKKKSVTDVADRLAWLVRRFGSFASRHLDPVEVERQASREGWRRGTVRQTLSAVQAFVRWTGWTKFRLHIPPPEYRGAECLVTPKEYEAAVTASLGDYGAYLRFLWETGCRPGEARLLTVEAVDWRSCLVLLKEHKTAKKGKSRTIIVTPSAEAILVGQRDKYASGPLFRSRKGKAMSMATVSSKWRRVRKASGVGATTVYAFRHSYITRALESGVPAADVAALVGTSIAMIERTYSHVGQNMRRLKEVAARISRS